jgi:tRNA dimethylallyltransferase
LNTQNRKFNLVTILGPTASGKTSFAAELAHRIGGEIISADSRQVYRKMNLGTGKDYSDYIIKGSPITCHLIDIHEPGYKYNVFEYQHDFFKTYMMVRDQNKMPILCGGSGMYIEAVTKGYKLINVPINEKLREQLENKTLSDLKGILATYKALHNNTDTDTKKRAIRAIEIEEYYRNNPETDLNIPEIKPIYLGLKYDRETQRQHITERLKQRLNDGMIEEVESLLNEGIRPEDLMYYGLEYKYITQYLIHNLSFEDMVHKLNIAIHQFAKRQMTWFRKMERNGDNINWIDAEMQMSDKINLALEILSY